MTATAQRTYRVVEPGEAAPEPLEDGDELLNEDDEPEAGWNGDRDFDTCSPVAAAAFAGPPSRMLLRRRLSSDGRIDLVSVEIEIGIPGLTAQEIKTLGLRMLSLEADIVREHLNCPSPAASTPAQANSHPQSQNGAAGKGELPKLARLIDIGRSRNNCYFINVHIGSQMARLFGSRQRLVTELAKAGLNLTPEAISEGLRLSFFCRAMTEPSSDGRYLNVVQLLPEKQDAG
jgi:hypothetical protein